MYITPNKTIKIKSGKSIKLLLCGHPLNAQFSKRKKDPETRGVPPPQKTCQKTGRRFRLHGLPFLQRTYNKTWNYYLEKIRLSSGEKSF